MHFSLRYKSRFKLKVSKMKRRPMENEFGGKPSISANRCTSSGSHGNLTTTSASGSTNAGAARDRIVESQRIEETWPAPITHGRTTV